MNPATSKIGALTNSYLSTRINPGVIYAVYMDYENDEHGDYTFFIGEENA